MPGITEIIDLDNYQKDKGKNLEEFNADDIKIKLGRVGLTLISAAVKEIKGEWPIVKEINLSQCSELKTISGSFLPNCLEKISFGGKMGTVGSIDPLPREVMEVNFINTQSDSISVAFLTDSNVKNLSFFSQNLRFIVGDLPRGVERISFNCPDIELDPNSLPLSLEYISLHQNIVATEKLLEKLTELKGYGCKVNYQNPSWLELQSKTESSEESGCNAFEEVEEDFKILIPDEVLTSSAITHPDGSNSSNAAAARRSSSEMKTQKWKPSDRDKYFRSLFTPITGPAKQGRVRIVPFDKQDKNTSANPPTETSPGGVKAVVQRKPTTNDL